MPTEIKLPRLGQGMDEGKILRWIKAEGESVSKGEEIYEVETEKVNVEVESPAEGTLLKIVVGEGQEVPVGTVIAYLGAEGESVPDAGSTNGASPEKKPKGEGTSPAKQAKSVGASPAKQAQEHAAEDTPEMPQPSEGEITHAASHTGLKGEGAEPSAPAAKQSRGEASAAARDGEGGAGQGRIKASPLARRIAQERGLELSGISGSGPDGRIVARDLDELESAQPAAVVAGTDGAPADGEEVPLTSMRRTIARRLSEAWQAPAFYLTIDIDMAEANELRERLVRAAGDGVRPSVGDVITKACAVSLRQHPDVNVHFKDDSIVRFARVHVGMAVATDNGLVVPVLRDVHARSIREIAADRKQIVDRARAGKLQPGDMEGGTFTISNLGMMGIDEFTAVLNPPMAAILAVGRTQEKVVAVKGRAEVRPRMTVTLGCDHRAVDGAVGARFLETLKASLEDPLLML